MKTISAYKLFIISQFYLLYFSLFFLFPQNISCQTLTAEQIYKKVSGTVVVIQAYNSNNELVKQGSGVVINDKGYIVTNYHVLEGCDKLEVIHNKVVVPYVDIIGIDVQKDILILKIDSKKFPSIKIGDVKKIDIGERVYAIGSPLGLENTISDGIISGLRSDPTTGRNFIQITASISPGSSGGAVVNEKGELIGISSYTESEGQNLNFAIPIDDILAVKIGSYSKNDAYKDFELFYKGKISLEKGNFQKSIDYYTMYLIKYPNDANAYINRGSDKFTLGDYQGALQDYNKAIEIDPNDADAYINRGNAKAHLGDYQGALQDYNKAIEIEPNDANAYLSRGIAKSDDLGDYLGALQDENRAIKLNSNYPQAYYNRGNTKADLGDYLGALQDYNKAIEIDPNYANAYNNRGHAKADLGDYQGAIQDYNKAIEIEPNDANAYLSRGIAKAHLGDNQGALQDYNKAIEFNPNDADIYISRGIAKYNLCDKYGACLDWSKAGELGDSKAYDLIKQYCNEK